MFETWVVTELIKQRFNAGQSADLFFCRDSQGHEVDVLFETPEGLQAIEIKSGSTLASDWTTGPRQWQAFAERENTALRTPGLVFGGSGRCERQGCEVLGWREFAGIA